MSNASAGQNLTMMLTLFVVESKVRARLYWTQREGTRKLSIMKLSLPILIAIVFLGATNKVALGKEWERLVPLQSTRQDVVREFNECRDSDAACDFTHHKLAVHIVF